MVTASTEILWLSIRGGIKHYALDLTVGLAAPRLTWLVRPVWPVRPVRPVRPVSHTDLSK